MVLKRIFFLTILLLIVGWLIHQVEHLLMPYHWGNKPLSKKIKYLDQNQLYPGTIFIGSSVTHRHIIPSQFDSLTNTVSSYNLAVDGQMPPQSFYLLDHLLERDSLPEYIFFELNSFDNMLSNHFRTTRNKYYFSFKWLYIGVNYILNASITWRHKVGVLYRYGTTYMEYFFKIGMRKDFIDYLEFQKHDLEDLSMNTDGYASFPNDKTSNEKKLRDLPRQLETLVTSFNEVYANKNYINSTDYNKVFKKLLDQYLLRAKQKNIHLIYVLNPIPYTFDTNQEMVNLCYSLPVSNRIDLANPYLHKDLYLLKYRWDIGHFNYNGARVYTQKLSTIFNELKAE